jgi:hypothetical protein
MKNDWLTASSFERTFDVVSAVNILSIHYKLALAHIEDPMSSEEIQKAKTKLLSFLNVLQMLIEGAEKDQTGIIVGTDSRLGELALQYRTEQKRIPRAGFLYTLSFPELDVLIASDVPSDFPKIVDCLDALRSLFDQYSHGDITGVFGDE